MEEDEFHKPYIKDEVQKLIDAQIRAYERCLLHNLRQGICDGFMMPWLATFALGTYIGYGKDDRSGSMEKLSQGMKAGMITTIGLAPLSIALALPLAIFGLGYGTIKYIIDGVKASLHDDEFEQKMTLHLYQWVEVVKRGRLTIRKNLKDMENHLEQGKNFILSDAALEMLQGAFEHYFKEMTWSVPQLRELLSNIDDAHNTWEHLFHEVSQRVKIPALNEAQWQKLEQHLINNSDQRDVSKLSESDIKEYLSFAIYFFTLSNEKHVTMLKHFIGL